MEATHGTSAETAQKTQNQDTNKPTANPTQENYVTNVGLSNLRTIADNLFSLFYL